MIAKLFLCSSTLAASSSSPTKLPLFHASFNGSSLFFNKNPLAHSPPPPSPLLTRFKGKLSNIIAKLCTCIATIAACPCAQAKHLSLFLQRGAFEKPLTCMLLLPLLAHLPPMPRVAIALALALELTFPSFS